MQTIASRYEAIGELRGELRGKIRGKIRGKAEGRIEGRAEGRIEGRASMLLDLLHDRFGEVSSRVRRKVETGEDEDLTNWARAVFRAGRIEEVFDAGT